MGVAVSSVKRGRKRQALLEKYKEPIEKPEPIGSYNRPYDAFGNGALHLAAMRACPRETFDFLIDNRANVNLQNDDGRTPLHMCGLEGVASSVEVLFLKGAEYKIRDSDGRTPLVLAAMHGYEKTVKVMLQCITKRARERGQDDDTTIEEIGDFVNMQDTIGRTALMWAVHSGWLKERKLAQVDLEFKLKEDQVKSRRVFYNFAMMASGNQLYPCWGALRQNTVDEKRARERGHILEEIARLLSCVRLFMKYKARLDIIDMAGGSVLQLVLLRSPEQRKDLWAVLLTASADRFTRDYFLKEGPRGTLLHDAANVGDETLCKFCAEHIHQGDLGIPDQKGRTALHLAAEKGHLAAVEVLQAAGAPTDAHDENGHTPGDIAYEKGHRIVAETLAMKISVNDFAGAGRMDDVKAQIFANPGLVDRRDAKGRTPLMAACLCKRTDVANYLLDNKADPNLRDKQGFDAFCWLQDPNAASMSAIIRISSALVAAGMDLTGKGHPDGNTPLMLAASAGNMHITKLVLDARSDVNAANAQGKTALHLAVLAEQLEVVRDLVTAKADAMKRDAKGFTPIALALRSTTLEMRAELQA